MLNNRTYDVLKFLCTILIPAIATLYFTLAQIWGLPYAEQVVGTLAAIATFIGALIGLSSKAYYEDDNEEPIEYGDTQ